MPLNKLRLTPRGPSTKAALSEVEGLGMTLAEAVLFPV
jgi:hypothetical protein